MDKPAKSPDAFRTISEVSDLLDVPQHVLRFWETKFPQVAPMKRAGNRRYYDPAHIDLLGRIRDLLYVEGYTTKGVQKLLEEDRLMEGVETTSSQEAGTEKAPTASLVELTNRSAEPGREGAGHVLPKNEIGNEVIAAVRARLEVAKNRLVASLAS